MKASYFVALFALFAVANAYGSGVEDSKTQYQSADGTQGELTNSEGLVVSYLAFFFYCIIVIEVIFFP